MAEVLTQEVQYGRYSVGAENNRASFVQRRILWINDGANLVLNGNGLTGSVTGWVATGALFGGNNDGTLAQVGGKLRITEQTFSSTYTQALSTIIGGRYLLTFTKDANAVILIGSSNANSAGLINIFNSNTLDNAALAMSLTFTATSTITYLSMNTNGVGVGLFHEWNNLICVQIG